MTETLSPLAPPNGVVGGRRSMIRSWISSRRNSRSSVIQSQDSDGRPQSPQSPIIHLPQLSANLASDSLGSSASSFDGGEPRPSTLNFLKRKSMLGSPSSNTIELPSEEPRFSIDYDAGRDGYVYHPGGLLRGKIGFVDCGPAAADVKTIHLRVIGEVRFTHYDMNESVMRRVVRTSRQRFLALPPLKIDRKGIWETEAGSEKGKEKTVVPFELRLPEKCYSIFDPYKSSRNRATLPPTMHWTAPKESTSATETFPARGTTSGSPVNVLIGKLKKVTKTQAPEVTVQIRYFLDVHIRWKASSPFSKTTVAQSDFIVVPRPPVSTSIKHAIPAQQPRMLDSSLAVALGATQAIDIQHVRDAVNGQANSANASPRLPGTPSNAGETTNAADPATQGERLELRRSRAPTIGYQGSRQLASAQSDGHNVAPPAPQWTKLVLINTPRGPQAWQIHQLKAKEELHDWTLNAELSMPATVALLMDASTPFRLSIANNISGVKVKKVNIKLLRSIASNTSYGKLILESMQEATLDGRPVLEIRDFGPSTQNTAPPLDEYADNQARGVEPEAFEGTLLIASGWKQSRQEVEDNAHKTLPLKAAEQEVPTSVQRGSLLTTPSFVFRSVTVEYALGVEIVFQSEGPSKSSVTAQTETAPIKIASLMGSSPRPSPPPPERDAARMQRQRSRSRLAHARSASSIRRRPSRQQLSPRQRQHQRSRSRQAAASRDRRREDLDSPSGPSTPDACMTPSYFASINGRRVDNDVPPLPQMPIELLTSDSVPADASDANAPGSSQDHETSAATSDAPGMPSMSSTAVLQTSRTRCRMTSHPPSTAVTRPIPAMSPPPSATRGLDAVNAAIGRTVAGQPSSASLRTIDGPAPPYCKPYQDM